jgi:hypothetical protein
MTARTTTNGRYPTTAEWLAKRDGVIVVAHFAGLMWQRSWGWPALDSWGSPMLDAFNLARSTNANHLLIKINDDAQTIRVLVDGDDALVVVHARDCGYHKSMRRGMMRALRGLKTERKAENGPDSEVLRVRAKKRGDGIFMSYVTIEELS